MATQADVDLLNAKLDGVVTATDSIATDTAALKEELRVLNENNPSIDLGPAIAKAEAIEARLTAIAGPNPGSDPVEPPVEEPFV